MSLRPQRKRVKNTLLSLLKIKRSSLFLISCSCSYPFSSYPFSSSLISAAPRLQRKLVSENSTLTCAHSPLTTLNVRTPTVLPSARLASLARAILRIQTPPRSPSVPTSCSSNTFGRIQGSSTISSVTRPKPPSRASSPPQSGGP